MLIQLIKTLILPRIETVDLEVQGQVQTSPFMPNLNTILTYIHLLQSKLQFRFISEFQNRNLL